MSALNNSETEPSFVYNPFNTVISKWKQSFNTCKRKSCIDYEAHWENLLQKMCAYKSFSLPPAGVWLHGSTEREEGLQLSNVNDQ